MSGAIIRIGTANEVDSCEELNRSSDISPPLPSKPLPPSGDDGKQKIN